MHECDSPRAARKGLAGYFEFYNQERLHQSLGCRTPAEVYFDTGPAGPFRTFMIEWLEIDARHQWGAKVAVVEQDSSAEIERRLQEINVPYERVEGNIRIIGYVRNG